MKQHGDIIKFVRQRDLVFRKELGHGACGRTVLLYDDLIDEQFVCKKYAPRNEQRRAELFENFRREIKILHLLQHPNIVRIFNYYLYPSKFAGYLLMEFVEGRDIHDYLSKSPENAASIFRQAIDGFYYLETKGILHRDIRPANLLVAADGQLKIIDFGFGKQIADSDDFGNSVSLNWWCEPPDEFRHKIYDFKTEVYFVGRLFDKILATSGLGEFEYASLLSQMSASDPAQRISSFSHCRTALLARGISDLSFGRADLQTYREFANYVHAAVSKLEAGAKYLSDPDEILRRMEALYLKVMLEEFVPDNTLLIDCFLEGSYRYYSHKNIPTSVLHEFLALFRSCSRERRNVVLSNLHTKLDSLARYHDVPDEDIPF